jgi:uncharacterized protein (DUF362 family)
MKSQVYVIKTSDREMGIKDLVEHLGAGDLSGKKVAIKANYNSSDPFPASTHPDTLSALVDFLKENGFLFPDVFSSADAVVQTCCLKTHRFGGHFTMSLKNSVGMVARYDPKDGYDYMGELYGSRYHRQMIAEINAAYEPVFVIMDAIEGFSKGGPDTGTLISPGILLASRDGESMDAAGVALLRIYGTTDAVSKGGIFKQEQIARAAELGLGASAPEDIELIAVNEEAKDICKKIEEMLSET